MNVLIIDGNMKNRRDICAATEAGFIEYVGLPGTIKTGCQQSPTHCSKFCYDHSPRVANMSLQDDTQQLYSSNENVVGFITSKKQTRSGTYYQVMRGNIYAESACCCGYACCVKRLVTVECCGCFGHCQRSSIH